MNCPICHDALVVVEREGIELDWCLKCRGLWFDNGELELLGEKAGRALDPEDLGRGAGESIEGGTRRCPRCRRKMQQLSLASGADQSVQVDRCPEHGNWLDRGELGMLMSRRAPSRDTDEGLMLEFLGETFGQSTPPDATSSEGREP
jgi:Zn-finger nucleic acid-binding protein